MSVRYELKVSRDMRLTAYEKRLKASRDLELLKSRHGLVHKDINSAWHAAQEISKNPLVDHVLLTRVESNDPQIFRNGKSAKS